MLYFDAATSGFVKNRSMNLSGPDALAQGDDVRMMMSWILHVCLDLMLLTGSLRVPKGLLNSLFCSEIVLRADFWVLIFSLC